MHYLVDYHVHSNQSDDGKDSMIVLCERGIELGIQEVAFTDHFEPMIGIENGLPYDVESQWKDICHVRELFQGKLKCKIGLELGQPHMFYESSTKVVNAFNYDFILIGAHRVVDDISANKLDYSRWTLDALCKKYLEETRKMIEWHDFDCLAHIDYIKGVATEYYKKRITFMSYQDVLEDVLKTLILKGKGIEINTSGLRKSSKETMPGLDVLTLYKQLGGEILTIGSDTHKVSQLGRGIEESLEMAKSAGFRYITIFEIRKPEWIKIV